MIHTRVYWWRNFTDFSCNRFHQSHICVGSSSSKNVDNYNNSRWETEKKYRRFIVFSNWLYNTRNASHNSSHIHHMMIVRLESRVALIFEFRIFALTFWLWLSIVEGSIYFDFRWIRCVTVDGYESLQLNEAIEKVVRLTAREFALNRILFCTHQTNSRVIERNSDKKKYV